MKVKSILMGAVAACAMAPAAFAERGADGHLNISIGRPHRFGTPTFLAVRKIWNRPR